MGGSDDMKKSMTLKQVEELVFYTLYDNASRFIEDLGKWYVEQLEDEDYEEGDEFAFTLDLDALEIMAPLFQLYFSEKALLQKYDKIKVTKLLNYFMNKLPGHIKVLKESEGNYKNYDISNFNHQKSEIYNLLKITESRKYANNAYSNVYNQMAKELIKLINFNRQEVYDIELITKVFIYILSCEEKSLLLVKRLDGIRIIEENQKDKNIFKRITEKINRPVKKIRKIYRFKNGDTYEGNFENGNKSGYGILRNSNGEVYEGEWLNNLKNGKGKYIFESGEIYEGSWKDDFRDGYGINHFDTGETYNGQWKNDTMHGKGLLIFSSGSKYDGDFENGHMNGYGIFLSSNGNKYEGEWKNDIRHGLGVFEFLDGTIYTGEFRDNIPDGNGIWEWPNGTSFEGKAYGYDLNGIGIYKDFKTGLSSVMIYENGVPKQIIENKCFNIEEVKLAFYKYEVTLGKDQDYSFYKDFLNICILISNLKLSGENMLYTYKYMLDVIVLENTKGNEISNSYNIIKKLYYMFDEIEQTKGKLKHEEKLLLSFCFYTSKYVSSIYHNTEGVISNLGGLTSLRQVYEMYEQYRTMEPEFFEFSEGEIKSDYDTFGYSIENPILCMSISMEYEYVRNLRSKYGSSLEVVSQRLVGGMKDCLKLAYDYKGEKHFIELYFNGYSKANSMIPPDGFVFIK